MGLDFVNKLVTEHVKTRPGSGREATDVFLQGTGDVLLSYENEAINVERQGKPVEHINPPQTFKIENPVAVALLRGLVGSGDKPVVLVHGICGIDRRCFQEYGRGQQLECNGAALALVLCRL